MPLYTPVGYLLLTALLLALAATPVLRAADHSWHPNNRRTATIDGLRGFLALGVFFHHALISHRYLIDGAWTVPPSTLYTQLGQAGVTLFFMVTGYLFWGKAIDARGRLEWVPLYIGRVFRIGPLYYLAIAAMLGIVFWRTGFRLQVPAHTLWQQISPLLLLGLHTPGPSINTYAQPWIIIAGVTWTLAFEWRFYVLLLPVSALFARKASWHLPYSLSGFALMAFLTASHPVSSTVGFGAFFAGMSCASLRALGVNIGDTRRAQLLASGAAVVLLALLLRTPSAYALMPLLLLAGLFALVSLGCRLFGLLTLPASRRLGEISYGIYLLQGLVLYAVLRPPALHQFAMSSNAAYWLMLTLAGIALVLVAMLAHVLVEKPGIALGRRLAQRWRAFRQGTAPAPATAQAEA